MAFEVTARKLTVRASEDTLFCALRPARYVDKTETVEFSEVHVFAGPHFVVTVRHGEAPDIAAVRRALESRPDLLRRRPVAILHATMDRVLDDDAPVVAEVENDIDEIEDEVFNGSAGTADISAPSTSPTTSAVPLPSMCWSSIVILHWVRSARCGRGADCARPRPRGR